MNCHRAITSIQNLPSSHFSIRLHTKTGLAIFPLLFHAKHHQPTRLYTLFHLNEQKYHIHFLHRLPTNLRILLRFHMSIYLFRLPYRFSNIPHISSHHPRLVLLYHVFRLCHSILLCSMSHVQDGRVPFEMSVLVSILPDHI